MQRILINATHKEELRIAIATGQHLDDLIIESIAKEQKQANIYKGKITRIEPSLEAAFVDYGEGRHGFLSSKEIARNCFKPDFQDTGKRPAIADIAEEGQELILQIKKEERDSKGAALTTFISLPGCYLVLMPNNPRAGGISRRIDNEERGSYHEVLSQLQVPDGMGIILRTAGGGKQLNELQWDLDILLKQWDAINQVSSSRPAPFLIYQEGNALVRTIRDYLRQNIEEILIDNKELYDKCLEHLQLIRPDFINKVKLYVEPTPLFNCFQIESQIEAAFQREVRLPSGGSLIIDRTEALVSIDINSAKATKGGDIEETATNTNIEAAEEIARQLRLRDIGGLIVIDFIDMNLVRNQREVEERLRNALTLDRAKVQIGRISKFGLLEMSRQRLRSSLSEASQTTCPRCSGQGTILGVESLSLSVIRLIEEEALKDNTAQVRAILPIATATYILNEKRQTISDIEKRHHTAVIVIANPNMLTPEYKVERIKRNELSDERKLPSYRYNLTESAAHDTISTNKALQEPAIQGFINQAGSTPAPVIKQFALFSIIQAALAKIKAVFVGVLKPKQPQDARQMTQHQGRRKRGGGRNLNNRATGKSGYKSRQGSAGRDAKREQSNKEYSKPYTKNENTIPSIKQDQTTSEPSTTPILPTPITATPQEVKEKKLEKIEHRDKKMRFAPGKSQRRFEPSSKTKAVMRTTKEPNISNNNEQI